MSWERYSYERIRDEVFGALRKNVNYRNSLVLGVPGTNLDPEIFYDDAPFLNDAPFLSALIANPNHIGCHTFHPDEDSVFRGTIAIETDLIRICAEGILRGEANEQDGYIASGGTEANIQALWIYRNFFMREMKARAEQIAILCSDDSHYSIPKGANLLQLRLITVPVDDQNRSMRWDALEEQVRAAMSSGVSYFIAVANLGTTMFGSVDDVDRLAGILHRHKALFRIHVDAAFGGFVHPFTYAGSTYSFRNKAISSFTIDGHKMLQAPYGTGIFLIRKGYMQYVQTNEAGYIPGSDHTLCGSRSGANAVAVWMILRSHGSEAWTAKISQLMDRTSRICARLSELNIPYFRNAYMNIIAIRASAIPEWLAKKYHLVADTYTGKPQWYKIVVMPHVRQGIIDSFVQDLQTASHKPDKAVQ